MSSAARGPATATPSVAPTRSVRYPQPWSRVFGAGMYGAVVALLLCSVCYAVMRLAGVPMEVSLGRDVAPTLVGWPAVAVVVLGSGALASLLAALIRRSPRAPRLIALVGTVVYLVSLAALVMQPPEIPTSTRLCLAVLHTVTYLVIVWFVARGVTAEDPPTSAKLRFGID